LMAAGFVIGRRRLTLLGALSLYLPVFGSFAFSMFFLAGTGILRILWLPMLDASPAILKLGGIVYLPYIALVALFRLLGIDAWVPLSFIVMGAGALHLLPEGCGMALREVQGRRARDLLDLQVLKAPPSTSASCCGAMVS